MINDNEKKDSKSFIHFGAIHLVSHSVHLTLTHRASIKFPCVFFASSLL